MNWYRDGEPITADDFITEAEAYLLTSEQDEQVQTIIQGLVDNLRIHQLCTDTLRTLLVDLVGEDAISGMLG